MKCINCNEDMKDRSYNYYSLGDWDMDYPASHHEEHYCKSCKIKYIAEDYGEGEWIIPNTIEPPTERQINAILFINKWCRLNIKPLTKKQCIKDIGKYLQEAIKNKEDYNNDPGNYDECMGVFYNY